jgi:hypothetical protein
MCGVVVLGYAVACKSLGENILDAAALLLRTEAWRMVYLSAGCCHGLRNSAVLQQLMQLHAMCLVCCCCVRHLYYD